MDILSESYNAFSCPLKGLEMISYENYFYRVVGQVIKLYFSRNVFRRCDLLCCLKKFTNIGETNIFTSQSA